MTQLNRETAEVAQMGTVHGATDITGYGFVGHAFELAKGSGVTLSINSEALPILPGTEELARRGLLPGGIMTNRDYVGDTVSWGSVDELHQHIFLDPQTSGGLLLSVPGESAEKLRACATLVGRVEPRGNHLLRFS
jgi:selenide,water dikinase